MLVDCLGGMSRPQWGLLAATDDNVVYQLYAEIMMYCYSKQLSCTKETHQQEEGMIKQLNAKL